MAAGFGTQTDRLKFLKNSLANEAILVKGQKGKSSGSGWAIACAAALAPRILLRRGAKLAAEGTATSAAEHGTKALFVNLANWRGAGQAGREARADDAERGANSYKRVANDARVGRRTFIAYACGMRSGRILLEEGADLRADPGTAWA